jgi:hypothetical protein
MEYVAYWISFKMSHSPKDFVPPIFDTVFKYREVDWENVRIGRMCARDEKGRSRDEKREQPLSGGGFYASITRLDSRRHADRAAFWILCLRRFMLRLRLGAQSVH